MEKKMKHYLRAIRRRLNMPKELKDRVMNDFVSSIEARKEAGQTNEEIFAELGTPKKAAAELNEQMREYTYRKSPWRWLCLALAALGALCIAYRGLPGFLLMLFNKANNASVGIIGGADGPTAIFVTTSPDTLLYSYGMSALLLVMGLLGFIALSRLKQK